MSTVGPTGDGSQHVRDEYLHQRLVQQVVTVSGPAQHRLELAQRHQARLGQPLLRLVVPGRGHAPNPNPPIGQTRRLAHA